MAEVILEGVTRRFGDIVAVRDLDLHIDDGEFVVLLGATGAGKTTTLRLIAGLERVDAGRIMIGGHDATARSPSDRDIAFVFQQYSLYPHLSVFDNLAFPLRSPVRRQPADAIEARVREIAAMLRIDHKLESGATTLSGGEMQRVAIGRALVRDPAIHLMDEPLSSLDARLRSDLRLEIKRIQTELGTTILYVTHDQIEAMTMADRIGVLRAGRLVQLGTPREVYEAPLDTGVATILGTPAINLLPAGLLPVSGLPAAARTVGARTEHIGIERRADGACRVTWIEHLGDQNHLHLELAGQKIVTLADPASDIAVGDALSMTLGNPLFFDGDGRRLDGPGAGKAAA